MKFKKGDRVIGRKSIGYLAGKKGTVKDVWFESKKCIVMFDDERGKDYYLPQAWLRAVK